MADDIDSEEEERNMEDEFQWLLKAEVHGVLRQLNAILEDSGRRFNIPGTGKGTLIKPETFVLSSSNGTDYVKGIVTLVGDLLCKADLTLRPHRNTNQLVKTYVRDDMPWRLQQVQDVGNHIYSAIEIIKSKDVDYEFQSAEEVNKLMDEILSQLMRARQRFLNPLIPSLQELYHSRYTKSLTPPLPHESMVNFYILGTKLVLHTYYLHPLALPKAHNQKGLSSSESKSRLLDLGPIKYELFSQNTVECAVPWVEEVTACLAFAMQLCQELKDKVSVFACCWDEYR
ncbi:protein rogdi homolog isoform X2 [Lytechinus variegatus]|uniref:protein rogdi homolog isoform X2 n=1 Tax=Lytechinus variegatus TaxID=7654 RepID=UPI001BB1A674|nr:protein rogdi homolog isoform X2 [Lytechinus variegatus]